MRALSAHPRLCNLGDPNNDVARLRQTVGGYGATVGITRTRASLATSPTPRWPSPRTATVGLVGRAYGFPYDDVNDQSSVRILGDSAPPTGLAPGIGR